MPSPTVSYLIPSYNHEDYLPALLESIKQDIQCLELPAEVIIIDDGSSDNSHAIIETWADAHGKDFEIHYTFQENQGLANVLNQMIAQAKGEYLRLGASDDVFLAGSTQKLYQQFKHNPELHCVFADGEIINEDNKR